MTRILSHLTWLCLFPLATHAADYYFDSNGATPGSGVTNGSSYNGTPAFWSTTTDGTGSPVVLPGRQGLLFSAGTDAYGLSYAITGNLGQVSQGITVQEGQVTLTGGGTFFSSQTVRTTAPGTTLGIAGTAWDFYNNTITFETAADAPISLNSISTTSGRGGHLIKTGSGLLTLTGNATANGFSTVVHAGELRIQTAHALFSTGYPTKSYPVTVNSGGTLSLTGGITVATNPAILSGSGVDSSGALRSVSGQNSWNALLTLAAPSRLSSDAGASLTLAPPTGDAITGPFPLTISGAGNLTVSRPIAALTSLTKDGPGLLTLSAVNTFTGPTSVSAGILRFIETAGTLASLAGPLAVNSTAEVINADAQPWSAPLSGPSTGRFVKQGGGTLTLSGTHGFHGTLSIQSGTLALAASASLTGNVRLEPTGGTLDVSAPTGGFILAAGQTLTGSGTVSGALTFAANSILEATPGAPPTLTAGATLNPGTVIRVPASPAVGTYVLLRATGGTTLTGSAASLTLAGFIPGARLASLQFQAGSTELALVVSNNPYTARALTWQGDGSANAWNAGQTTPWRSGGLNVPFTSPDHVTFDATGAGRPTINLDGLLTPGSITVNAVNDYTFAGSGTLQGSATLTKSGSGRLVITGNHTFTGGTTINQGTVELRAPAALGTGTIANQATLAITASGTPFSLSNPLTGSGALQFLSGNATLAGNNSFTGPVLIETGILTLGHVSALGTTAGSTTIAANATLDLAGFNPGAEPIILAGGTLRASSPSSLAGPISLTAASTIEAPAGLTLSGPVSGSFPLLLASGNLILAPTATSSTPISIAAGATLNGAGTLGGPLTIHGAVSPNGLLSVSQLTLGPDAVTTLNIQKSGGVPTAGRLAATGTLTRGGSLFLTVSGQPLAAGDTFTLLSAGSIAGSFAKVQLPWLYGDLIWDRSSFETNGVLRVIALPAVSTMAQRRDWILTRLDENPDGVDGFTTALAYFARGDNNSGRAYALTRSRSLLANHLAGAVQVDLFYIWPAVDMVARYGPLLDDETKANLRQIILTFYQYKDTTTSNLKTLGHVVRFLGGELYGQAAFDAAKVPASGLTNDWRASDPSARTSLLDHMNAFVVTGAGEVASRPYLWKNILPILSLAQLAQDPVIRQRAALVYEACLAQHASYWLRGHLAMPTTRSYPDMLEQHPSSGASMGHLWYHFGGELPALDSDSATMAAAINPTVSPILELAASDRSTPTYARSRNGPNYLHAWLDQDYALFADGPIGPNSGQVYANGVVWTDSNRSHYSHLWVVKPIQDDPASINVSNTHGKERRQYSETVARDALLYIYNIAPPAPAEASPTPYAMGYVPGGYRAVVNDAATTGQIFLHYGSVLIAIRSELPFGWNPASGIAVPSGTVRAGDSEFLIDGDTDPSRPPATLVTPLTSNLRFALAIETARPDDFAGATPAAQLAAFRTAVLAVPRPTRTADATPTASYTTRCGDRLRLTDSNDQNPVAYPLQVNDLPIDPSFWPRIDSPWISQPQGQNYLLLRSPNRREVLNFSTWTRTVLTGVIDMTPPVLTNLPGNLNLIPDHPAPIPDFGITAIDAVNGSVPVVLTPPAGSVYTPGTTTIVTATATDASLNTTTASFAVTFQPYSAPPPSSPWSVQNIGAPPDTPGTATHLVASRVFTVAGTGGTTGTGASGDIWSGTSEGFTYLSRPWPGDGIFTARVYSFTAADNGAKAGIIFRESLTAGAKNSLVYMSRNGSATFQTKTSTNGTASASNSSNRGFPEWIRLVRSGHTFTGFYSPDGLTWTQQGSATINTLAGTALTVGLAVAPRTGGQTANVIFDNVTFHTPLDAWRFAMLGTDSNTGSAADLADPDGDSANNLLEYALGGHPLQSNNGILPVGSRNPPGSRLAITFLRARADLTYTVEAASSLSPASWSTVATNPGTPGQSVTVTDTVDLPTAIPPRRFLRLSVTAP